MFRILIVEDESIIRQSLKRLLIRHNYEVAEAETVQEARSAYNLQELDLIITDLRLPGEPGTELIQPAAPTPVLVMTSYASLKSAVESMKMGAVDYIAKPFDHDEMIKLVKSILNKHAKNPAHKKNLTEKPDPQFGMIGKSAAMQTLYQRILKAAPSDSTVLIVGESGTGKELVAKALHNHSPRADGPLISVNCAAIPETLIEAELFGHEKGAFTGANTARKGLVEAADGGTLFLDEIGELPLEAQARLLRLLQEKEVRKVGSVQSMPVDVRIIAATHRNLKVLASQYKFREDLYYRLHVIELKLSALRERDEDIIELAHFFLATMQKRLNRDDLEFSPATLQMIRRYTWPGNVRELEHAIERAVVLADGDIITPDLLSIDFDTELNPLVPDYKTTNTCSEELDDPQEDLSLEDYFQRFVLEHQEQMTETELAQKLGISRKTLWERRQKLGLPRKKSGYR